MRLLVANSACVFLYRERLLLASVCEEAQKQSPGSRIDIKLCRLEKGSHDNKAYAINIQEQWDEERSMFSNRGWNGSARFAMLQ